MHAQRIFQTAAFILLSLSGALAPSQQPASAPMPAIPDLMREVQEHQKQLEKVRENYTYSATQTTQDIDANGQVKKTETAEFEEFFVNGHLIGRMVKKDGQAAQRTTSNRRRPSG